MKDTVQDLRHEQEPRAYTQPHAGRETGSHQICVPGGSDRTADQGKEMSAWWGYPSQPGMNNLKDKVRCSFQGERKF